MTKTNDLPVLAIVYITGDVIPESAELPTLTVFSDEQGNYIEEAELAPIKTAIEEVCAHLDVPNRVIRFYRIDHRDGSKEEAFLHALRRSS